MSMMLIGVDPHKSSSTATVVDPETSREVASIRVEATLSEYRLRDALGPRADDAQAGVVDRAAGSQAYRGHADRYDQRTRTFQHWRDQLIARCPSGG